MATFAATRPAAITSTSLSYERFAGICAILAGVVGFLYSIAFVVLKQPLLYSLLLLIVGLLTVAVMVAVYERLRRRAWEATRALSWDETAQTFLKALEAQA